MALNLWKIAGAALALSAVGIISTARSQQVVPTSSLQTVAQSAVPANSTTVGTNADGSKIVQTTDASVMSANAFPYSYGNLQLPNYSAAALQFNVSSAGTIEYSVAPSGIVRASSHVAGVDDVTAGLSALQDNNGGGCAIALCVAAGANAPVLAGPCQTILNDMARLLRLGQAVPSCAGSTITYTPVTCAVPWTLVSLGGWANFACQALIQPPPPPGPSVAEQCAVAYANAEFWSADIETGVYSDAAGNWYAWDVAFNTIEFVAGTVTCPNVSGGVGWGGYSGAGGTGADGNSSGNANSGNASDAGAGGASSGDGGGGGDGGD